MVPFKISQYPFYVSLSGSYTTLDKSMLDSVLYSDEPKKVSLPSLIDDDVLYDLYDDADRISSQVNYAIHIAHFLGKKGTSIQ